jgi:hypothetical protein
MVPTGGGVSAKESFDGRHLYYSRTSGCTTAAVDVFRCNPDGSGETKLVDGIVGLTWTGTRDSVYYVPWEEGDRASLWSYALATGVERLIARIPKQVDVGLSISPNGKTAILTHASGQ